MTQIQTDALGTLTSYLSSEYGTGIHLVQQSHENERMGIQEILESYWIFRERHFPLTTNCLIFSGKRALRGHGKEKHIKEKAEGF